MNLLIRNPKFINFSQTQTALQLSRFFFYLKQSLPPRILSVDLPPFFLFPADPVVLGGYQWSLGGRFAVDLGESLRFLLMASPHHEISSDLAFPSPLAIPLSVSSLSLFFRSAHDHCSKIVSFHLRRSRLYQVCTSLGLHRY